MLKCEGGGLCWADAAIEFVLGGGIPVSRGPPMWVGVWLGVWLVDAVLRVLILAILLTRLLRNLGS